MPIQGKNVYVSGRYNQGEDKRRSIEEDRKLEDLSKTLKPFVLSIVERSFREYARAHSATKEMEETEWQRFKKILNRNL